MPLDVLPKNGKNEGSDPVTTHLHEYVPQMQQTQQMKQQSVPQTNETKQAYITKIFSTYTGRTPTDYIAHATPAIKVKSNGETPSCRMEGFLPVVEDWHAKFTLFGVRYIKNLQLIGDKMRMTYKNKYIY